MTPTTIDTLLKERRRLQNVVLEYRAQQFATGNPEYSQVIAEAQGQQDLVEDRIMALRNSLRHQE